MSRKLYVIDGAKLQCDKGTAIGKLKVTSQQRAKINGKPKATNKDKMVEPPFFGMCSCTNKACSPALQEWQYTSRKSGTQGKRLLFDTSQIMCGTGGMVYVKDPGQHFVGTGKDEPELDKDYAKLQGEIIFANGYLSSSLGGALNALLDINPDEPNPNLSRGNNANEEDKLDRRDMQTATEVEDQKIRAAKGLDEKDSTITLPLLKPTFKTVEFAFPVTMNPSIPSLPYMPIKIPVPSGIAPVTLDNTIFRDVTQMNATQLKNTFYGYWNSYANGFEATKNYAEHFNAGRNQHYLNGSHGLASNGAHRLDHGIAQGYYWAKYQWQIKTYDEVEEKKKKVPYIKSYRVTHLVHK